MTTATLTSKGQITIPADVGWPRVGTGDRVSSSRFARALHGWRHQNIIELKGMFAKLPKSVSIDDMNKAIANRGAGAR
jgi:hypothetical protein